MTDPITPDKLRELADDLECGEGGCFLSGSVAAEMNAALRAAADEIERKDVALKVALNGQLSSAAEDIILAALNPAKEG